MRCPLRLPLAVGTFSVRNTPFAPAPRPVGVCVGPATTEARLFVSRVRLTNGTAYTFTVTATNAIGTSAASGASNSATPAGVPGAPTIGTATPGNTTASVTFTAPASNGGSAITGYTVTSSPGGLTATGAVSALTGTASPITITGLTNGTAYTFTVTATNAIGTGAASAASNSITPTAVVGPPGAPTITSTGPATPPTSGELVVSFTVPADGGSPITDYMAGCDTDPPGSLSMGSFGPSSPLTVTGLTPFTIYVCFVRAANGVGPGPIGSGTPTSAP